ncbi:hypothetical protein ABW19_dt0210318 [Dactylella cylindrospora]|nr:hypothetical protein ABW19_dt0210318 [Dactylella cylindrospora]
MPKRKTPKPSPHKSNRGNYGGGGGGGGGGRNRQNYQNDFYQQAPVNSRRGKAQRLILLGADFDVNSYGAQASFLGGHAMTMQQEARNTEERSYKRNEDRKLRQLGISFVRPEDPQDPENQIGTLQTISNPPKPPQVGKADRSPPPASSNGNQPAPIPVPTAQQENTKTHPKPTTTKPPSNLQEGPASDDEDQVVFVPRNRRRQPSIQEAPNGAFAELVNQKADEPVQAPTSTEPLVSWTNPELRESIPSNPPPTLDLRKNEIKAKKSAKQKKSRMRHQREDEDEILEDYIRNIIENGGDEDDVFSLRPLGGHLDEIELEGESSHLRTSRHSPGNRKGHETSGTEDDQLDIRTEVEVAAVIGKRTGKCGTEYHFKPAGSTVKEAIWLEGSDMTGDIQYLIDHFEAGLSDSDDGGTSSDSGSEKSDTEVDGEGYGDDETLARILQAQERGLTIQDIEGDDDEEEFDDEYLWNMMQGKPNINGKFPSASKLADAYDDFDVIDRSRPSLTGNSRRKSRKAMVHRFGENCNDFELDNEEAELMADLERSIAQDRERKRERKQQRDALRQAGVLGKPTNKPGSMDFRNMSGEVSQEKINEAIKSFLMSGTSERLSLMPMTKFERAGIHTLAHKFCMTSKSQGKGNSRFPVLYKTKRTVLFEGDEEAIDRVLRNHSNKAARGGASKGRIRGGQGDHNKIFLKDGMIVGTGAAEIGEGNKGYEMLAKMGWTTGTGLGSNRSGILDPVQAIIKRSRTGLG